MCNIAAHGDSFCATLLDQGALKEMIPLFRSTDTDTVHYAMSFCEMLLHSSSDVSLVAVCCLRKTHWFQRIGPDRRLQCQTV